MDLYIYCASKNPVGTAKVVQSFGLQPSRSTPQELASQLAMCVKRYGQEALERVSYIHPDRQLFSAMKEEMSNASGCGCSNADGTAGGPKLEPVVENKNDLTESKLLSQNHLIIGGILVLALAVIFKK
tara:strand:- start:1531 stop:1914 length:384 start_codon:yes stop_codon:yes gene_type:complete